MNLKKIVGFNLIELMITLIIISILSALGIPLYTTHLAHARRLAAEINLIKLSSALEHYYLLHNTYQNANLVALQFPEKIADNNYQLIILSETDTDFLLQATPLQSQIERDFSCGSLLLNSRGEKSITGTGKLTECWN